MKLKNTEESWRFLKHENSEGVFHPVTGIFPLEQVRIQRNGVWLEPLEAERNPGRYRFRFSDELYLVVQVECERDRMTIRPTLSNEGNQAVLIGDVELARLTPTLGSFFSFAYQNGRGMVENTGMVPLNESFSSNAVIGFTDREGTAAFAAGAVRPDDAWYDFLVSSVDGKDQEIQVLCRLENTRLAPQTLRTLSPIRFYSGHSLSGLVGIYAADVAEEMKPLKRFPRPPSGWCSWYRYYGNDDTDDIRRNMQAISESSLRDRIGVIQIDDGWNRDRNAARNWGDWMPDGKYPEGMKALADEIHAAGFQAGLWLAPFSVDEASQLFKEHPDWLVREAGSSGELDPLAGPGGVFGLDLTKTDVQGFIRKTFRRVFDEWGFDYIKIDFLSHGAIEGLREDQTQTGIEAFRIGMKIILEEAGSDRFILNCGSPMAASVGLCDGMRIGLDVGGRWSAPMNLAEWRYGNCCIKAAAVSTIWRQWMHGIWWHNDPDCIVLRDRPVPEELDKFINNPFQNRVIQKSEFGLNAEEAACWLRLVWMSGGMFILSEEVGALSAVQQELLKHLSLRSPRAVRWMDQYSSSELGMFRTVEGELHVGLFNLSDHAVNLSVEREQIGVSRTWRFAELITGEAFDGSGNRVNFPELQPRSGRVWILQSGK